MNHKPHCPVPVITYNGNLIVAAATKYPAVAARLPANYLTDTTTAIGKLPTDISGQKTAKGETGNLTTTQQTNLNTLHSCMAQAAKTAKLAFAGQTVKLHQEFQIGAHDANDLASFLSRCDTVLASVQNAVNLPALKLKGWTDAETTTFQTARAAFGPAEQFRVQSTSGAKDSTTTKNADAATLYENLLTIQNAADLQWPAANPTNAGVRDEFLLNTFPPNHGGNATPTPAPTPTPQAK